PHSADWEEAESFPAELYAAAADAGITGIGYPEELGGSGGNLSHLIVASEELLLAGRSVGTIVGLGSHSIAVPPLLIAGSQEQKQRFVPPVLRGEKICALAVTEPGGGSDVARLRTRAVRDGDFYRVTGAKTFITSGVRADWVTLAVRTGEEGHGGLSLLVVERGTPGFSVSRALKKTGWWASDTAELMFDDAKVPVENLIGEEGSGFFTMMQNFASERLLLAGQCVAIAELALAESLLWVRQREAFGRPIAGFQVTRHRLAEMATRLRASRAMVNEAVVRTLAGEGTAGLAAMTKNTATDMCSFVCDAAVQLHGGYGYMRESLVERLYRDARLYPIGGGTREIMNELIAKMELELG
ncbi:MAG TPA: acyl-CoA dehydrogenase family protein, partial [Myxococcota bacterium]|nr:acyl-CoA dehydrogenase family protein [Myxococcota bacterium]